MKKEVIFVGWVNQGKPPVDGETTKNQYIIAELQKYCKLTILDFYNKKAHPWIFVQAFWAFISMPKATIILSTSAQNVYSMLQLFKRFRIKRDIIHWVIGGSFGEHIQKGRFSTNVFNYVKYNLVQCQGMIAELEAAGIKNAKFVSNFKPINYYPDLEHALLQREKSTKIRFVFVSRIILDKGCDYILTAVKCLNKKGLKDKFIVDFYGKTDAAYKDIFLNKVEQLDNVSYHGLLNLKEKEGYDTLATYHAMLFPSFWRGEGFAGIFIDAFIAGLPVLASDWAHNAESITDGKLGIIYPVHNVVELTQTMEDCIDGKFDLEGMARNARKEAQKYQTNHALSEDYLKSIGLIK